MDELQATITVPRNVGGLGYHSVNGIGFGFPVEECALTQVFEGAADLDIGSARPDRPIALGRVWVE